MKNLISTTDFVIKKDNNDLSEHKIESIFRYAKFLKQTLEKWMFVPCKLVDGVWVVLDNPKTKSYTGNQEGARKASKDYDEYQEAKEKCLFEGFEYSESHQKGITYDLDLFIFPYGENRFGLTKKGEGFRTWFQLFTVEDLVQCKIQLTENALKQICK